MEVRTALLSVTDKTGIVELACGLEHLGIKVISTGGTYDKIRQNGFQALKVEDITEFPEMMDGRLKTLHPRVHGGILARRDNDRDMASAVDHGIPMIDLVAVNLYQFEEKVRNPDVTIDEAIESIDIGGPTMLRAAAKNWRHVGVVCDPGHYGEVLEELQRNNRELSDETRFKLAQLTFTHTAHYEVAISNWLYRQKLEPASSA